MIPLLNVGSKQSIPAITIRRTFTAAYQIWDGPAPRRAKQPISNRSTGRLSTKAKQRLTIAIELLIDSAQTKRIWWKDLERYVSFKVSFITLTLPSTQKHTDSYIVTNMLKPFLRWWRDKNPSLLYIWKAEVQDNGNIHFHITTNAFIHWRTLRKQWNRICDRHDYIDHVKLPDPNSTDVHGVRNIKDLAAYITGYVAKKDLYTKKLKRYHKMYDKYLKRSKESVHVLPRNYFANIKRALNCKLWDASKLLLEGPCRVVMPDNQILADLCTIEYVENSVIDTDYARLYTYKAGTVHKLPALAEAYRTHLVEIRKRCKESIALLD